MFGKFWDVLRCFGSNKALSSKAKLAICLHAIGARKWILGLQTKFEWCKELPDCFLRIRSVQSACCTCSSQNVCSSQVWIWKSSPACRMTRRFQRFQQPWQCNDTVPCISIFQSAISIMYSNIFLYHILMFDGIQHELIMAIWAWPYLEMIVTAAATDHPCQLAKHAPGTSMEFIYQTALPPVRPSWSIHISQH